MMIRRFAVALLALVTLGGHLQAAEPVIERVTTAVPYPRGLAIADGDLYILARGRVRGAGGVTAAIDDRAGTLYRVRLDVSEPLGDDYAAVGEAVRTNGEVVAEPTSPPFRLWDRSAAPPESDRHTDRPYCTLRYHAATQSFYLCAFSGIDMQRTKDDPIAFSKNLTDALLRYDLRTQSWHEVERHKIGAGGNYPHHDPRYNAPPHGWLNGPDNCLIIGNTLYAVAKDNNLLVAYDLSALASDPAAGPPPSRVVLGSRIRMRDGSEQELYGHSALATHGDWLYIGYRSSSVILRIKLDAKHQPVQPIVGELVATFDPYDPASGKSANLTDMCVDDKGRVYVVSAKPSRVYRFSPDPKHVFDGRTGQQPAWADMAAATANPKMKSENVLFHNGWLYITSGDGYSYQAGADGTVYRVRVTD